MMGFMLLFWLLIIWLGISSAQVLFNTTPTQAQYPHKRKRSPLERLQERYAYGEISREEYHAVLDDIYNQQGENNVY